MRPTGKLHLGNYMGALANWVKLQDEYECYFFIADLHALTTDYADTSAVTPNTLEVALDFLAAGLDPAKCTIFVQSHVKPHFELPLLLGMITPLGWLERVPTYKEQQDNLSHKDLTTYGFLGYPLLMASDILLYQPEFVPVGQDQQAHVEFTREVARRFNHFYPRASFGEHLGIGQVEHPQPDVLPEPRVLLTPSPKLPGTDGRKMSKSYGNTILMTDPEPVVRQKLKTMVTDPARVRRTDPGDPDKCPVGDRVHSVQGLGRGRAHRGADTDPAAAGQLYRGAGRGNSEGRVKSGPGARRADHGASARGDAPGLSRAAAIERTKSVGEA
jgi:tryptophanyl-tRNA synthetase